MSVTGMDHLLLLHLEGHQDVWQGRAHCFLNPNLVAGICVKRTLKELKDVCFELDVGDLFHDILQDIFFIL